MPICSISSTTGKIPAACKSSFLPITSSGVNPRFANQPMKGIPRNKVFSPRISPLDTSSKPYGRTTQRFSARGTMSTHTPSGSANVQSFLGTPVIICREPIFHDAPTKLFSIQRLSLLEERVTPISAFCTKIAGFGFTFRCII